ncbi:MAG: DUF748 domain-containing protein [Candidatus Eisenbacteria bacterium]|nr:DUF748 domain-containing protein [Candidatus Eisenbacteria bacterium]
MDVRKRKRWALIALLVLVVLIVGGIVGFRVAVSALKGRVVEALPPDSEIKSIRVGWSSVKVEELRIKGPSGWPAVDALRAERVSIVPSLRSILSRQYQIRAITMVKPYLSALRTKDGRFLVVPGLLARAVGEGQAGTLSAPGAAFPGVTIGHITLQDAVVEIFDATVAEPPLKIRLEKVRVTVRNVVAPGRKGKSWFELAGVVKGVRRDGQADVAGWVEGSTNDSSVKTQLRSVDLLVLQPYLIKVGEMGVQKGSVDLDLQSDVSNNRLRAPGKITISDLELTPAKGPLGTFMGLPRQAVMAFLMKNENRITVNFVLEGNIKDPQFSLNETFTTRLAFATARVLGLDLGGMAKGLATLGQKGGEATGQAAKGAGGWLWHLFRGKKK